MTDPWLIVAGDFALSGGMDAANYHLAWHLADRCDRPVSLVAHRVAPALAAHPRVTAHLVPRPGGRHLLGAVLLDRAGRRAAADLTRLDPAARVVLNGDSCLWPGVNWVHLAHCGYRGADVGAPWWFRLKNRLTQRYFRRREARALRHSRLVITNSDATRRQVVEGVGIDPRRVHTIYLGVDADRYGPVSRAERDQARTDLGVPNDVPLALFVGALGYDRRKGFDTLLAALPAARSLLGRPVTVLAAGGGALAHWLERVASLGLADSVRFLGHVDRVPALLAVADVLVSPARYEPYGLNVHEAICRGVPAVVSRSAGVAERYPPELDGLLLNDPEDSRELAGRIVGALRRREADAPHVRRLGAEWRERWWEVMAAEMVRFIDERYGAGGREVCGAALIPYAAGPAPRTDPGAT